MAVKATCEGKNASLTGADLSSAAPSKGAKVRGVNSGKTKKDFI